MPFGLLPHHILVAVLRIVDFAVGWIGSLPHRSHAHYGLRFCRLRTHVLRFVPVTCRGTHYAYGWIFCPTTACRLPLSPSCYTDSTHVLLPHRSTTCCGSTRSPRIAAVILRVPPAFTFYWITVTFTVQFLRSLPRLVRFRGFYVLVHHAPAVYVRIRGCYCGCSTHHRTHTLPHLRLPFTHTVYTCTHRCVARLPSTRLHTVWLPRVALVTQLTHTCGWFPRYLLPAVACVAVGLLRFMLPHTRAFFAAHFTGRCLDSRLRFIPRVSRLVPGLRTFGLRYTRLYAPVTPAGYVAVHSTAVRLFTLLPVAVVYHRVLLPVCYLPPPPVTLPDSAIFTWLVHHHHALPRFVYTRCLPLPVVYTTITYVYACRFACGCYHTLTGSVTHTDYTTALLLVVRLRYRLYVTHVYRLVVTGWLRTRMVALPFLFWLRLLFRFAHLHFAHVCVVGLVTDLCAVVYCLHCVAHLPRYWFGYMPFSSGYYYHVTTALRLFGLLRLRWFTRYAYTHHHPFWVVFRSAAFGSFTCSSRLVGSSPFCLTTTRLRSLWLPTLRFWFVTAHTFGWLITQHYTRCSAYRSTCLHHTRFVLTTFGLPRCVTVTVTLYGCVTHCTAVTHRSLRLRSTFAGYVLLLRARLRWLRVYRTHGCRYATHAHGSVTMQFYYSPTLHGCALPATLRYVWLQVPAALPFYRVHAFRHGSRCHCLPPVACTLHTPFITGYRSLPAFAAYGSAAFCVPVLILRFTACLYRLRFTAARRFPARTTGWIPLPPPAGWLFTARYLQLPLPLRWLRLPRLPQFTRTRG